MLSKAKKQPFKSAKLGSKGTTSGSKSVITEIYWTPKVGFFIPKMQFSIQEIQFSIPKPHFYYFKTHLFIQILYFFI